jgi:acetyl-CoA acetyltransferase
MSLKDKYAFVGLGVTKQGKVPEKTVDELAAEAILLALEDSGMRKDEIDGYIYQEGIGGGPNNDTPLQLAGIPSNFCWSLQTQSSTGISSISAAIGALEVGLCENCIILHSTSAASQRVLVGAGGDVRSTPGAYGWYGEAAKAACIARRHMHLYGLTKEQLGAVALTQREYANLRPDAYMYERKMTMEDYLNARMIVEPISLFDCCLVTDGAVAQIITRADKAKYYKKPPVYIMGLGSDHSIREIGRSPQAVHHWDGFVTTMAGEKAFRMAEVTLKDINVAEMYDAFTMFLLSGLEAYGICGRGEAGPFVEAGNLKLNGSFPTNTSGSELSWGYVQGFTQTTEGIRQLRGEGGATQVKDAEICLCTGLGGGPYGSSAACAILRR